jgi:AMP nucleosidase
VPTHPATDLVVCKTADEAVARITELYDASVAAIRDAFARARLGEPVGAVQAYYPYLGIDVGLAELHVDARLSNGVALEPGSYGTTLTRPDLFGAYYEEQIGLLMGHHGVPVRVGRSKRAIPLPFVIEEAVTDITEAELRALQEHFALPDLSATDDAIANGARLGGPDEARPLALFTAERVDYSPAPLYGHLAGALPELRAPDQLPALRRRVHRLRPRPDRP